MSSARKLLSIAIVATFVAMPGAARADTAAPATERQAAAAYADAALTFSRHAQRRAKEAWRLIGVIDPAQCMRALGRLEKRRGLKRADRQRAEGLGMLALSLPMMRALQPALDRFAASLEAVPTRDPALRSGRAAWRQQAVLSGQVFGPLPEGVCRQLRAWERGGARGVPLPEVELDLGKGTITEGVLSTDDAEDEDMLLETDGKTERAAERLRQLGQGPRRAARFTGESAIAPYVGVIFGLFGVMLVEGAGEPE